MTPVEVIRGDSPIVLGQPHGGTHVPDDLWERLNRTGQAQADTDWHIGKLYDGLLDGATVVRANIHRYVIDANRDPAGVSLYPGRNTTDLCPVTDFDGRPIWREGQAPSDNERAERLRAYHAPYHAALAEELRRARERHGVAVLYDCHSIRSEIPFLFEGTLPVFSIGANDGMACDPALAQTVERVCVAAEGFDTVVNGRFKGGWTTRHYGRPNEGLHAIQMELAQRAYMTEAAPWTYCDDRAASLRSILSRILTSIDDLARSGALTQTGG